MKIAANACRSLFQRFLKILGLGAAGASIVTVATGSQVFASLFLKETMSVTNPEMVYDPKLQLMVRPGTDDPIFLYRKVLRGKENGEFQVAPLTTKTSPPPPPPPPPQVRRPPPPPPAAAQDHARWRSRGARAARRLNGRHRIRSVDLSAELAKADRRSAVRTRARASLCHFVAGRRPRT